METPETFISIAGSDYPGMKIQAIAPLKLTNRYLSEVPHELLAITIPENISGSVDEITASSYKLNLTHKDKLNGGETAIIFWMRRIEFANYFKKLL